MPCVAQPKQHRRRGEELCKMTVFHDEIEIEDFEYDEETEIYHFPCPCGDRFEISQEDLMNGEDVATCPSCSLVIKVIYDIDDFLEGEVAASSGNKEMDVA
ncbi:DPH3 homolog [Anneissia japonica]|uniref:DPH3 homolog n=1 Tax=Anneissia japonica TaxID=1529436 RepID=UPI0014257A4A|nr:DPH3 homolog [Anneissia japonica]